MVTNEDWAARQAAWSRRAQLAGPERAPYHVRHRPEDLARVQAEQWSAVEPSITRAVADPPYSWANAAHHRWIDFGCGAGRWTGWLAQRYEAAVLGVDLTPELLNYANMRPAPPRGTVDFAQFVNGVIPVGDETADVLFAWTVLSAVLDETMLRAVTDEWRRVLRPGGLIVLLDNTSKVDGRPVRSPMSISRTTAEYSAHFAPWAPLVPVTDFEDLGEINTLFLGERVR